MKLPGQVLGLSLALAVMSQAWAGLGVCGFYKKTYESEIVPKIQAGVPFELMATMFEDGRLTAKKVVHVKYNLWDEIVILTVNEQVVARTALTKNADELCQHLDFSDGFKGGNRYTYRLLLNPMWGERMARLQASTGMESHHIIGINWKNLASEMPSEKVLLEKEVTP